MDPVHAKQGVGLVTGNPMRKSLPAFIMLIMIIARVLVWMGEKEDRSVYNSWTGVFQREGTHPERGEQAVAWDV